MSLPEGKDLQPILPGNPKRIQPIKEDTAYIDDTSFLSRIQLIDGFATPSWTVQYAYVPTELFTGGKSLQIVCQVKRMDTLW